MDEAVERYYKKYGKRTKDVLNYLLKEEGFIKAIESDIGQEIMEMHMRQAEARMMEFRSLLEKNQDMHKLNMPTVRALCEYNVSIEIVREVQGRIRKYYETKL